MKSRSKRKDGRKTHSARVARSKPDGFSPSVPPFAAKKAPREAPQDLVAVTIAALTIERQNLIAQLRQSIYFYDRVAGNETGLGSTWSPAEKAGDGWTASDVQRMAELRKLAGLPPLVTHKPLAHKHPGRLW